MRRKPEFDRFHKGLSKRIEGAVTQLFDTYNHDFGTQELINLVRSEVARTWKYLIERINKQEQEIQRLREALEFYAMKSSWVPHDAPHLKYTISISDREEYSFGYYGGKRAREVLNKEKE
jgi:predicted ribosome quality control (RQC) complex YloA/Tae2 family protein